MRNTTEECQNHMTDKGQLIKKAMRPKEKSTKVSKQSFICLPSKIETLKNLL